MLFRSPTGILLHPYSQCFHVLQKIILYGTVNTTYSYNLAGELKGIAYTDGTPPVSLGYDAEGRVNSVADAAGTHTLTYDALGRLESESIAGGLLDAVSLDPHYTTTGWKGRLDGLQAGIGATGLAAQGFGYEPSTGRLQTVGDGTQTATYGYLANSDQIGRASCRERV